MDIEDSNLADDLYREGNQWYERGEFDKAIEFYSKAIELDPLNYKFWYNRGLSKACLERYDEALADIIKTLELKPNFAEGHYIIGLCLEYLNKTDEAIKEYNVALELTPDFNDAKNRLELCKSKAHSSKTNTQGCGEALEQAREREKDGELLEALEILEKALAEQPDNFQLLLKRRGICAKIEASFECETVIGLEELRRVLKRIVLLPVKSNHPIYKHSFFAKRFKGILLYGPPGCGKTLLVKTLAKEGGFELVEIVLSDILNLYVGESEKRLTVAFDHAKNIARSGRPVLLFIDEADALGHERSMTPHTNEASWDHHLSATLLELFNEIQKIPNFIVIAATNRPWSMDEALMRTGRLGAAILYCPPPDKKTREEMFRHFVKIMNEDFSKDFSIGEPPNTDLKFQRLAKMTEGFSGDDIRGVCSDVFFETAEKNVGQIQPGRVNGEFQEFTMKDFEKYIEKKTPQTIEWFSKLAKAICEGEIEMSKLEKQLQKNVEPYLGSWQREPLLQIIREQNKKKRELQKSYVS